MKLPTSLRRRLVLSVVAVTVLIGVIFVSSVLQARSVSQKFDTVQEDSVPVLLTLEEIESSYLSMIGEITSYGYVYREAELANRLDDVEDDLQSENDQFFASYANLGDSIEHYRQLAKNDEDRERADQMQSLGESIFLDSLRVFGVLKLSVSQGATLDVTEDLEESGNQLGAIIEEAVVQENDRLDDANAAIDTERRNSLYLQVAILFVAIALLAAIGFGMVGGVLNPVQQLERAAIAVRTGNFDYRVDIPRQDELGILGGAFNDMASSIQRRDAELRSVNKQLEGQLTETEKAREAAERSDQVKSAFLASMSHELRTPLNSVINFTKFVVKGMMGPVTEEQVNTLNEVIDSAKHLLNLINDVLDMSKIESGSLRLFVEDNVNIQSVLDQVVSTGKSLIVDRPVEIQTEIPSDLPLMRGDRQRLLQILLNIMSNACKFTEEGQIMVRAAQQNGSVKISISDNGPGIDPEDQVLVFEPFKQTNSGLRQGGGTGLGMPISKNLTEAHGGKLWLESAPGKGATFIVELPIQSALLSPVQTAKGA